MAADSQERIVVTIRPGLHITQTCLRVGERHYQLGALTGLHTRQSGFTPLTRNAALLAGLSLVALVTLARFMHPVGVLATVLVLIGLLVIAGVSARVRPRRLQLWATYRGRCMPIFVSDDAWLFGAVDRQLRRSLAEVHRGMRLLPPPSRPSSCVPHPSTLHPSTMHPSTMSTAF